MTVCLQYIKYFDLVYCQHFACEYVEVWQKYSGGGLVVMLLPYIVK